MVAIRRTMLPLLAALALAFALSACGSESDSSSEGHSKDVVEGQPVQLGELTYNVTFSRFLNPNDNEDSAYLVGQSELPPGYSWFGVFIEVQNESDKPQNIVSMSISDAEHKVHAAFPSESLYALHFGEEVEPEEQLPVLDSTAQQGPIEGALVLFRLPASASENRPLTLSIDGPGGPAKVTLDL